MKIKYVTLTGADNNTSIDKLVALSERFSFVEWGILFSRSKSGVERYPDDKWVEVLVKAKQQCSLNLSAHLCGGYVKDAFKGVITFLEDEGMDEIFGRIQLNCYKERLKKAFESEKLWDAISRVDRGVILGGNYTEEIREIVDPTFLLHHKVAPLFDASGGHGNLPREWPKPFMSEYDTTIHCGYAGGLGPENIEEELVRIEKIVGTGPGVCGEFGTTDEVIVWIDMETKVRTGGNFDLKKCEVVLKAVEARIMG